MKYFLCITISLLLGATAFSQQGGLRDLTNEEFVGYLEAFDLGTLDDAAIELLGGPGDKCGFELTAEIIRRRSTFSPSQLEKVESFLAPPELQVSITSPSGLFTINYDRSGSNAAALLDESGNRINGTADQYAAEVAKYFDEAYQVEVDEIGYEPPPGQPYVINIVEHGSGIYGITKTSTALPGQSACRKWRTYIDIDNDFRGYYSSGLEGARVTAAHEFHHMVQLGGYGFCENESWFYEMTSTYYEERIYEETNDYWQYMKEYFNSPEQSIYYWPGYQVAHFPMVMKKEHNDDVLRRSWEYIRDFRPDRAPDPFSAMEFGLVPESSDLATLLCKWARYNYLTDYRTYDAPPDHRYDDGGDLPLIRFAGSQEIVAGTAIFNGNLSPISMTFFEAFFEQDTVVFAVTNTDVESASDNATRGNFTSFRLDVSRFDPGGDAVKLSNGWYYKFVGNENNTLCLNVFVNKALQDPGITSAYPNPFDPARDSYIRFPIPVSTPQTTTDLGIFTIGMDLVYSQESSTIYRDERFGAFAQWNGQTNSGESAASGVYYYSLTHGGETTVGKFAIIRR
ncbi:MAG: hypothetical protein CL946_08240 [Ectothiorhodospiraceae bacterium]|nr:hypothetical protein [Ectothiorhodospiraceae bacterium]